MYNNIIRNNLIFLIENDWELNLVPKIAVDTDPSDARCEVYYNVTLRMKMQLSHSEIN